MIEANGASVGFADSQSARLVAEYVFRDAGGASSDAIIIPALRAELRSFPANTVLLDLGCGNGAVLSRLKDLGFLLHGIDSSVSGITHACRAFPGIDFSCADVTADLSPFKLAGKCDVVISTEVVEHIFLPRLFAANCYRMLKPGGRLLITTPYHGYLKNLALSVTGRMDAHFCVLWDFGHIKFWSLRTLSQLLKEAGFVIEGFRGIGRIPYLWKSMLLLATKPLV